MDFGKHSRGPIGPILSGFVVPMCTTNLKVWTQSAHWKVFKNRQLLVLITRQKSIPYNTFCIPCNTLKILKMKSMKILKIYIKLSKAMKDDWEQF